MPTAFIVFSNEKRGTLKNGLSFGETMKELGKMWRALSDAEKAKYQAKASPSKSAKPANKGK